MPKNFDEWVDQYRPIPNPTGDSGFCIGDDCLMYETYAPDLDVVTAAHEKDPRTVWTLLDVDGDLYLGDGFHYVNRMGYFITEVPYEGQPVSIKVD